MAEKNSQELSRTERPVITSYDSVNEHSVEYYEEVRRLVEDAHREFFALSEIELARAS